MNEHDDIEKLLDEEARIEEADRIMRSKASKPEPEPLDPRFEAECFADEIIRAVRPDLRRPERDAFRPGRVGVPRRPGRGPYPVRRARTRAARMTRAPIW